MNSLHACSKASRPQLRMQAASRQVMEPRYEVSTQYPPLQQSFVAHWCDLCLDLICSLFLR